MKLKKPIELKMMISLYLIIILEINLVKLYQVRYRKMRSQTNHFKILSFLKGDAKWKTAANVIFLKRIFIDHLMQNVREEKASGK